VTKQRLFVSVSGGKSSLFMAYKLSKEYSDQYELLFGFANTAQENEETLVFMDRCDREWSLGTVWLEAEVYFSERKATGHRVVTFETASRDGRPYEDIIKKYGIPNKTFPHCTRELKLNPIKSYLATVGWTKGTYKSAVGIRADESRRLRSDAEAAGIVYPLAYWFPTTKEEVNDWWSEQAFNLQLEDYQGNCKWCWKKSTPKLVRIAQETPGVYEFPRRMEEQYGSAGHNPDPNYRRTFFRGAMSTNGLISLAALASPRSFLTQDPDEDSGCSESCEAFVIPNEEGYTEESEVVSEAIAIVVPEVVTLPPRHEQVLDEIKSLKTDIMERALYLGKLLVEVDDEQHYLKYGYPSSKAWLLNGSGLDLSDREAYYLKRVVRRSRELSIPDADLLKVKLSKLKRICSLTNEEATPEEIKALVHSAETASLKTVTEAVNVAKKMDYEFRTFKWERDTFENVIAPAFERIRKEYGGTIDEDGKEQDVTDSRCVEMIFADYLSQVEDVEGDIVDGDFIDSYAEETEEVEAQSGPL
jgi:hypothetical protein